MGRALWLWLSGLALLLVGLYLLRGVLLPFVAGMAVAYLLDPVCDRLEGWGFSRTLATSVITVFVLLLIVAALVVLVPVIAGQVVDFLERIPAYVETLRKEIPRLVELLQSRLDPDMEERVGGLLADTAQRLIGWTTDLFGRLVSGGVAIANLLSLIVITPVVAFYLLRDWDRIVATVDSWLPRAHAETIRDLAREVDSTLAGFLRGQGSVCLILGTFYAVSLSLMGLDFALVVGLIAGVLTFIPYVGATIGLLLSVGLAAVQFGEWLDVGIVTAIFIFGQVAEGNFLTPRLVGRQVRLHPVWVIFGLLAGGALFGFVGVLLAVPAAAVIGVGIRFALSRYRSSVYYHGGAAGEG